MGNRRKRLKVKKDVYQRFTWFLNFGTTIIDVRKEMRLFFDIKIKIIIA